MFTQSEVFLLETFDIISSTTILGVFYGLVFSLYCLCARSLYLKIRSPDQQRRAKFWLGYISLLFFCATILLLMNTWIIQLVYINHGDFPGGGFFYEVSASALGLYQTTDSVVELIIEVLTMAVQIWRLWIIWSATQYAVVVTILPVLLLLGYIALDIPLNIVIEVVSRALPERSYLAMETTMYIVLSSFTALVTGLIAAHILLAWRRFTKTMGMSGTVSASPYLGIVAMLVESYALESAWSLAIAISYALGSPGILLLTEIDPMVKIIAYFLVVYHVENGQGWTKQTEEKLTNLQFNHCTQSAGGETSGLRS